MLRELSELIPVPIVFGVGAWALTTHFLLAPAIAHRITEIDYRPVCEATARDDVRREVEAALAAVPEPVADPSAEIGLQALQTLNGMPGSRWGAFLDHYGFNEPFEQAARAGRMARERAKAAYENTRSRLQAAAEARIADAPDLCVCELEHALQESRTDWSVWVGTFGLVEQSQVTNFGAVMTSVRVRSLCAERVS